MSGINEYADESGVVLLTINFTLDQDYKEVVLRLARAGVETTEYMPFGPMREHSGAVVSNFKYTDQELDPETGLYFYGARYYDPVIGRFISADTVVQNFTEPQNLNRYTYCLNYPLSYVDPNGHAWWLPILIGAIIGGGSEAVQGGDIGDIISQNRITL